MLWIFGHSAAVIFMQISFTHSVVWLSNKLSVRYRNMADSVHYIACFSSHEMLKLIKNDLSRNTIAMRCSLAGSLVAELSCVDNYYFPFCICFDNDATALQWVRSQSAHTYQRHRVCWMDAHCTSEQGKICDKELNQTMALPRGASIIGKKKKWFVVLVCRPPVPLPHSGIFVYMPFSKCCRRHSLAREVHAHQNGIPTRNSLILLID